MLDKIHPGIDLKCSKNLTRVNEIVENFDIHLVYMNNYFEHSIYNENPTGKKV